MKRVGLFFFLHGGILKLIDPYKDKKDPYCTAYCKFFRCGKRILVFRHGKRICGLTGEECDPRKCIYASCVINRYIASQGLCGLMIKRKTKDIAPTKFVELPENRFKGKIRGDKELLY